MDEVYFYNRALSVGEVRYLAGKRPPADVTAPGDVVLGVPNDGLMDGDDWGWPGAETPDLAIDDDITKKFLHFKGEDEPTGFQVTPAGGPSIVTGLTFTTANDEPPRDPVAFELYGSNVSIDGPYELIASGDIVDFAQADAWPRFTMNETPISFNNSVAYAHYQVLFPVIRDAASANSMQIAEVELIGVTVPEPAGDPSLVIYYNFDEVGDIVADQSGKGNDGVVVGDVTAEAGGMYGGAANFASSGYLDLDGANFPAEDIPTSGFTLAAWTNVDGTSDKNAIFNAKASDPDSGHVWLIHPEIRTGGDNDYRFTIRGAGSTKIGDIDHGKTGYPPSPGIGNPRPNEWVHVAMTYSKADATMTLYVDGQIVLRRGGDGAGDPIDNAIDIAGNWDLGARVGYNIDDARHYTGLMDEFYMFKRELSQDEILELMQGP
jgi:hypothetical protein